MLSSLVLVSPSLAFTSVNIGPMSMGLEPSKLFLSSRFWPRSSARISVARPPDAPAKRNASLMFVSGTTATTPREYTDSVTVRKLSANDSSSDLSGRNPFFSFSPPPGWISPSPDFSAPIRTHVVRTPTFLQPLRLPTSRRRPGAMGGCPPSGPTKPSVLTNPNALILPTRSPGLCPPTRLSPSTSPAPPSLPRQDLLIVPPTSY
mmetsp:Transcript_6810/g.20709  ORF Transcript_6810/g.20709 Transcript_6810/m.20709 type:complete len:205 (+) Transcript_6810:236-850(+)